MRFAIVVALAAGLAAGPAAAQEYNQANTAAPPETVAAGNVTDANQLAATPVTNAPAMAAPVTDPAAEPVDQPVIGRRSQGFPWGLLGLVGLVGLLGRRSR